MLARRRICENANARQVPGSLLVRNSREDHHEATLAPVAVAKGEERVDDVTGVEGHATPILRTSCRPPRSLLRARGPSTWLTGSASLAGRGLRTSIFPCPQTLLPCAFGQARDGGAQRAGLSRSHAPDD